ncbi:unnamed protein product [marine sediment metagenome]|uniref:Uncharacterized protein n=1 Tax=marine sediment metagenome TaxID=412755 RepID=X1B319_9ZZZZ
MGKITVTVPKTDRIYAINKLANAIDTLASALLITPTVSIIGNTIMSSDVGMNVDFREEECDEYEEETEDDIITKEK